MELGGLSTVQLVGFGLLAGSVLLTVVLWAVRRGSSDENPFGEVDPEKPKVSADGGFVQLPPPETKNASLPVKLLRLYKHDKQRKKVGKGGYLRWILIDDTVNDPKFIKPKSKAGGIPEYDHDGETYLFPRDALRPDEKTGMWTAVHVKGDAMPVNLDTPGKPSVGADELKEFLNQRVTSSPPSFFDQFDLDASDLLKYAIIGFIVLMLAQSFLGGL